MSFFESSSGMGERGVALLEILLLSGFATQSAAVVLLRFLGIIDPLGELNLRILFLFTVTDTILILLIVSLLQWRRGGWVDPFGLRPADMRQEMKVGFFLSIPFFLVLVLGSDWFFRHFLPELHTRENPILKMLKNSQDLAYLLTTGILAGAVREEIQRAFVLNRLQKLFLRWESEKPEYVQDVSDQTRLHSEQMGSIHEKTETTGGVYSPGIWIGLIAWSLFFGFGHRVQGPDAVITTFVAGFLLGCVFLWRKSVIGPMACHGLANTAAILGAYYFPGLVH